MSKAFPGLRAVTSDDPKHHSALLRALREAIEIAHRERGDHLKSFVKLEELVELGLADELGNLYPVRTQAGTDFSVSNTGIIDFKEVADPGLAPADHAYVQLEDVAGISQLHFNDSAYSFAFMQDRYSIAKNTSGGTLAHGTAVYITGATGHRPTISAASAASGHHALGLVVGSVANNGWCRVLVNGSLTGFDTSAFTDGDVLFLSTTAGAVTNSEPAHPNASQAIGVVAYSHANQGIIAVHHHSNSRDTDGTSHTAFRIGDSATDRAILDVLGSALSGSRTFTFPDASGKFAMVDLAQAFTALQTFNSGIELTAGGPKWTKGAGTPEGVVTAPVGSLFSRTDGGAGTSLYVKETGSGNTGWVGK